MASLIEDFVSGVVSSALKEEGLSSGSEGEEGGKKERAA